MAYRHSFVNSNWAYSKRFGRMVNINTARQWKSIGRLRHVNEFTSSLCDSHPTGEHIHYILLWFRNVLLYMSDHHYLFSDKVLVSFGDLRSKTRCGTQHLVLFGNKRIACVNIKWGLLIFLITKYLNIFKGPYYPANASTTVHYKRPILAQSYRDSTLLHSTRFRSNMASEVSFPCNCMFI